MAPDNTADRIRNNLNVGLGHENHYALSSTYTTQTLCSAENGVGLWKGY